MPDIQHTRYTGQHLVQRHGGSFRIGRVSGLVEALLTNRRDRAKRVISECN
jgi:hypothetical protein